MIVSQEQLETSLQRSEEFIQLHPADDLSMFILFVKAE